MILHDHRIDKKNQTQSKIRPNTISNGQSIQSCSLCSLTHWLSRSPSLDHSRHRKFLITIRSKCFAATYLHSLHPLPFTNSVAKLIVLLVHSITINPKNRAAQMVPIIALNFAGTSTYSSTNRRSRRVKSGLLILILKLSSVVWNWNEFSQKGRLL